ncbi:hypothetical protein ACT453_49210, partial [Bacillus sp. D-CC]
SLYFVSTIAIFFANLGLAEAERPELLTRSFDRVMLVKNLGLYVHQVYDLGLQAKSSSQKAFADGSKFAKKIAIVDTKYRERIGRATRSVG